MKDESSRTSYNPLSEKNCSYLTGEKILKSVCIHCFKRVCSYTKGTLLKHQIPMEKNDLKNKYLWWYLIEYHRLIEMKTFNLQKAHFRTAWKLKWKIMGEAVPIGYWDEGWCPGAFLPNVDQSIAELWTVWNATWRLDWTQRCAIGEGCLPLLGTPYMHYPALGGNSRPIAPA